MGSHHAAIGTDSLKALKHDITALYKVYILYMFENYTPESSLGEPGCGQGLLVTVEVHEAAHLYHEKNHEFRLKQLYQFRYHFNLTLSEIFRSLSNFQNICKSRN
jgi:hypothetical protein